jgi:hypothetical protein
MTPQLAFQTGDMCNFWLIVREKYPVVREFTVHVLLLFAASCLHKSAFSALTYITSEYCTGLEDVKDDLRVGSCASECYSGWVGGWVGSKIKHSKVVPISGSEGIAPRFLTSAVDGGECSASCPSCFLPRERAPKPPG